ncbi:MAG: hypothetical protein K2X27_27915 [Candidatus Obscuribacterales bacterium]|nr:hypothetical protein [Candidatus Obscuribacterales bacterium]
MDSRTEIFGKLRGLTLSVLCFSYFSALEGVFAQSSEVPPLAPDLSAPKQVPSNRYVQQSALMDNSVPSSANNAGPAQILSSLSLSGWEAPELEKYSLQNHKLVAAGGALVEEAGGKPASVLLEYGCIAVFKRQFKRGTRNCVLTLFQFAKTDGAFGAYTTLREGSSNIVMRGQASSEDQDSITFYSGPYLAILKSTLDGDDEEKEALTRLADQLSARLSVAAAAPPAIILSLPHFEKLKASEKYFMGSKAAMHYCNIPFQDALMLEQSLGAAYAEYQYSRPIAERLRLLLVSFPNAELAQSSFNSFALSIGNMSRKTVEKTTSDILCKMSDSYLMAGLNGQKVYVIAGARKPAAPSMLVRELR